MKHKKILNLLNEPSDYKFVTQKWNIVNDQTNYDGGNETIYNPEVLKYNLCDYNNVYILVRGNLTVIGHNVTQVAFNNCAPFTKCITKIDKTTVDDDEELNLVISMYNLL